MKILHVIDTMHPQAGGPCQAVRNVVPRLCELGHSVEAVCLDKPNSDYLNGENVTIHPIGQGIGPWRYHPALRAWLTANLLRFDAVILNGLWQYPGYVLYRLARHPGMPPYFIFPHGMLDPWFQRARERRFKAIRNWCYWKLIEHRVIHTAAALFFTCAEEMRLARETFRPYRPKRQFNVGCGVAQPPQRTQGMADGFAKKCSGLNGRSYFLFLSRIHPKKAVDLLIQAYATVFGTKSNSKEPATCLVVAGPGLETDYGKKMRELAVSACPPGSVFWPGMLSGDAKWGALYDADAFVLPSHQENFGIAVVEALACRTPVLISNQINIWREIVEDKAGLTGDDTLAGIQQVFRRWESLSREAKALMKRAARTSFENRFEATYAAQTLVTTLESLVKNRCDGESKIFVGQKYT